MTEEKIEILFEEDKKKTVTKMLDVAVKNYSLCQEDYLQLKEKLLFLIEKEGNEQVGLFEFMKKTNELVANSLGVEQVDLSVGEPVEAEKKRRGVKLAHAGYDTEDIRMARMDSKARLLKLIELLPPYLDKSKLEHYQNLIRRLPIGEPSEAAQMNTVGDAECEIMEIVRAAFRKKLESLIKEAPSAFYDVIEDQRGKEKKVNIGPSLLKQLERIVTVRQFLSLKDIIVRHVSEYKKKQARKKEKSFASKLKFW